MDLREICYAYCSQFFFFYQCEILDLQPLVLKFIFSKKATKIDEIFTVVVNVKLTVKIVSIFVAFLENVNFIISLLIISSSFSSRYTLEEDLCLTIVLSRAQNFCINRCKQKRLRILWYPVLAKTNGAKYCKTFKIHTYFIADFPRLNFLYHICKKVFFTNSRQLFLSIFVGANRIIKQLTWALAYVAILVFFDSFQFLLTLFSTILW